MDQIERFDLTDASSASAGQRLWVRASTLIMAGVILAFAIQVAITRVHYTPTDLIIWLIGLAASLYLLWVAIFDMSAPPQSMEADSCGLKFIYRSGRARTIRWDDPSLSLTLLDWRRSRDPTIRVEKATAALAKVGGMTLPDAILSQSALEYILNEASRHQLRIIPEDWQLPRRLGSSIKITAQAPGSSSGL